MSRQNVVTREGLNLNEYVDLISQASDNDRYLRELQTIDKKLKRLDFNHRAKIYRNLEKSLEDAKTRRLYSASCRLRQALNHVIDNLF